MLEIAWLTDSDRAVLRRFWNAHWGGDFQVAHGQIFRLDDLDGFSARENGEWLGLVNFYIEADLCEVILLDSLRPGQGIGTALLHAVEAAARQSGCGRLKLTTTNDNTLALRFYQKYGFELVALRPGAVEAARQLKPSIPEFGLDDIPIRDEIDLELRLTPPDPDLCT